MSQVDSVSRKLRKRFIGIVMLSLLPIIVVILVAINAFNVHFEIQRINQMLDTLSENIDMTLPSGINISDTMPKVAQRETNNTSFALARYYVITFDGSMNVTSIRLDNKTELEIDSIADVASLIVHEKTSRGWKDNYAFQLITHNAGSTVIMVDTEAVQGSLLSILTISLSTGAIIYLLVFVIVSLLSKRAISPLVEAYEQQRRFINDVGHELKTPLTVISAHNEIMEMTYGKNEWNDGIRRQTERMRRLFDQMLKLANVEEREEIEKESFSLSEAIEDTVATFIAITPKDCQITTNVPPNMSLYGNEALIRQLIVLLVDNAVKYCDEGGSVSIAASQGRKTSFSISNTYTGAGSLDYSSCFERFYQADSSRSQKEGYGLGLSIAKTIVEKHKGQVSARSVDDNTVEFLVTL